MPELLVIIAILVIVAGFGVLAGVAIWLAAERRRAVGQGQTGQPGANRPMKRDLAGSSAAKAPGPAPVGRQAAVAVETPPKPKDAPVAPAVPSPPAKDPNSSGEYPSAANYDQTWLPGQPKRRKRAKSE